MTFQPEPARPAAGAPGDTGQPERDQLIAQAHQRSESYGLRPYESPDFCPVLQSELKTRIERSQSLFAYALPVMETLYDQIVNTQSMVILTDADGLILHSMGDDDFLARANQVALRPGAEWSEARRGTNAIGTALAENRATLVHGADHFLEANQFLTCSCMTILDPYGKTVGALDVTGDQRGFHKHTMALVRMSAQMIENQLFGNAFRDMVCIRFHSRAEFLGTLVEGIVSFTPGGRFLSANRSGQFQLGLSNGALHAHTFSSLFGLSMSQLFDAVRAAHAGIVQLHLPSGVKVSARVEWKSPAASLPGNTDAGQAVQPGTAAAPRSLAAGPARSPGLDDLDTGDAQIRAVIGKLRKVIGKDIPVMVLGETGTGKELMARAIHADSPRHAGPFIAVNCASIPETLIESELFGYEEGAFTGARKKGGIGKMLLANGGTLFLDEIGDMPLHLQGRLLRALQERAVSPLGSSKVIHVDVSVVCATNRNLRDLVANGQFREDLYYRLNGLVVRLPALRERGDLDAVAARLLRQDQAGVQPGEPPRIRESVMEMFRRYHWPGNIRQLCNLLRTARLMAEGEAEITEDHLPDDFLDDLRERQGHAAVPAAHMLPGAQPTRLADVEAMAIVATVKAHNGNISAAAKALGISRNTVYRKMEEARGLPHQAG
ncbi:Transcriptional regulator DhaR of acetoin/glycerol metabolism [Cupriavidus necator]|uniref:Sigma-54-dependent Fis family transcriptional regulator n=1 Tax=Cupriavidus necator (strain ATCC 17699 / DSM 428 / KCTC 22496 / NCIMB 10442 / H16 / Stanier 337) TaxID=381666 RepID=Q0K2C8_CUPNH|nr:sigma-54-dependent Fis family transcriptional regulator [Cupriavidus necator]KUE89297.1 Fis family transcriptional regulator [Cupriavidus necator]QCC03730.1 sigma-54-dependent Fis family transcriptional regulator [Cupriavidus necator H16]QQB80787.1 sigma-54-dependent Fis family transcriptional regulator [Cupriavidus necator]WKA45084.1 sigma-54-dependent Fis family transcriptional regulator [Cupriavidus necator]CAJ95846.1 transcriptional regulator, PspF-family [Cupriavidus necator H16]